MPSGPNFVAGGNIHPSRVVKMGSADFTVIEGAAVTDVPIGIAQDGTHLPPGVAGADTYAAVSGGQIRVFTNGDEAPAEAAGAITRGDLVTVNGSTDARVATNANGGSSTGWLVGQALESASGAGSLIRIKINIVYSDHLS